MQDLIIVVDVDQFRSRSLARRLRAENISCHIVPRETTADELLAIEPRGVLLAGRDDGQAADVPHMMDYLQSGLPMLCLGDAALSLCCTMGGSLKDAQESSLAELEASEADPLLRAMESGERYLPAHRCMALPEGQGSTVAATEHGTVAFRVTQRDVWGVSFPLDRNDPASNMLLMNFCRDVCGCTPWWTERAFIDRAREALVAAAGEGEAICALSGGVDSGVSALLGKLALGEKLHCIFVDTGLLREGEADGVMDFYSNQAGLSVQRIDAGAEFLAALDGVYAPDDKEKVIGRLLKEILYREAAKHPRVKLLIRGTNYTDAPVSNADLPEGMAAIEPVRELFKDEIRHVGDMLGMPPSMLQKQPFPGSGLARRILSGVTATGLELLRHADAIFRRDVEEAGLHKRLWQYYATLAVSPIPNGGYIVILRAVQSADGGAGMPARLPSDLMERTCAAIMKECPGVQRVFYDLSPSQTYKRMAGA